MTTRAVHFFQYIDYRDYNSIIVIKTIDFIIEIIVNFQIRTAVHYTKHMQVEQFWNNKKPENSHNTLLLLFIKIIL